MQKPQLANNEIYHVYNRGVEKRKIFLEEADYLRFIHDIFEFNDSNPAQRFYMPASQFSEVRLPKIRFKKLKVAVKLNNKQTII